MCRCSPAHHASVHSVWSVISSSMTHCTAVRAAFTVRAPPEIREELSDRDWNTLSGNNECEVNPDIQLILLINQYTSLNFLLNKLGHWPNIFRYNRNCLKFCCNKNDLFCTFTNEKWLFLLYSINTLHLSVVFWAMYMNTQKWLLFKLMNNTIH